MPRKKQPPKKVTERPGGTGKRLTLSEKILIRAEKGSKSAVKVSQKYGVSRSTVKRLWGDMRLDAMAKEVATVKEHLANRLYLVADHCTDQVEAALFDASSKDAAIALNICVQNARLIDNESTQNINQQNVFLDNCNASKV